MTSPIRMMLAAVMIAGAPTLVFADTFYVSLTGDDANPGSEDAPFRTINAGAAAARAGDTVIVRAGLYREWVDPPRGGKSDEKRITFKAAEGERVIIAGSELVDGWTRDGALWRIDIAQEAFGSFNPYNEGIRHPIPIEADEAGDGWGWLKYGRFAHRGDLVFRGQGLTEKETLDEVAAPMTWHTQTQDGVTTIWAHFGDDDPNDPGVELSLRPFNFYPSRAGLNYITLKGFIFTQAATHWAPPTQYQPGAVGPNGGRGWVIEDNAVLYSRGVAISIGVPAGEANERRSGGHVIRGNILMRNGQAGIAGQSWNHDSVIEGNWIEDTNYRKEFGGWETAAIKIHDADNVMISGNVIRNVGTKDAEIGAAHGIWVDYGNRNVRVTGNIIEGAEGASILTEANFKGPVLYDRNIIIGGEISTYSSRGDAWVQNVFVNAKGRWENQDWGGRPPVSNARWLGNAFVGKGLDAMPEEMPKSVIAGNVYAGGALPGPHDAQVTVIENEIEVSVDWSRAPVLSLKVAGGDEMLSNVMRASWNYEVIDLPFKDGVAVTRTIRDDYPSIEREAFSLNAEQSEAPEFGVYQGVSTRLYQAVQRILSDGVSGAAFQQN